MHHSSFDDILQGTELPRTCNIFFGLLLHHGSMRPDPLNRYQMAHHSQSDRGTPCVERVISRYLIARNTTRASTTMRKSREAHHLADERALLLMEIEVENEVRNASAARLKTLQVRKSKTAIRESAAPKSAAALALLS